MDEDYLQYIWKFQRFDQSALRTFDRQEIKIIHPGHYNPHAGPDFFFAKIRLNGILWVGNVEIHVSSSNWNDHQHHRDAAYNNVILHVVYDHNRTIHTESGRTDLWTLELKGKIDLSSNHKWASMAKSNARIPCGSQASMVPADIRSNWQEQLVMQRLERRSRDIFHVLKSNAWNWHHFFYEQLAMNFGYTVNAFPFLLLSKSIPKQILLQSKDCITFIESLLYGQAGLLPERHEHPYVRQLKQNYDRFRKKYKWKPMEAYLWKYARLRPANFPTVRIAQFSALIHKRSLLFFEDLLLIDKHQDLLLYFENKVSGFWKNHYTFFRQSKKDLKGMGKTSRENLLINTCIPFIFAFSVKNGMPTLKQKAIDWLLQLPAERNSIVQSWPVPMKSAYESQAVLELRKNYCFHKKCLNCAVGNWLLKTDSYDQQNSIFL